MYAQFDIAIGHDATWMVNGEEVEEVVSEYLIDEGFNEFLGQCPHCKGPIISVPFEDVDLASEDWHYNRHYISHRCSTCGYWEFTGFEGGSKCMDSQTSLNASSVVAKYAPKLPEGCSHELAQYIRRNPNHWNEMRPRDLEILVADIYRLNYKNCEVFHVGKPRDRGVDVLFIDADGEKHLIQVKRREKPGKAEAFETLQRILGTLILEDSKHGIIVSTADKFSQFAEAAASDARDRGFKIDFVDKGKLDRMIQPLIPETPWGRLFSCREFEHLSDDIRSTFDQSNGGSQLELGI